ncbi:MAG: class I SAM-dependent methyltransferase [Victivallales bacterium]
MKLTEILDKKFYGDFEKNWDNLLVSQKVRKNITKDTVLLDLGAGAGIIGYMNFKGVAKKVIGVDLDERVKINPSLDEAHVSSIESMPFIPDQSCDVVVCNNVFEHIAEPEKVFTEVGRILKKGGLFIAKTPNKYHYVPIIASLTPVRFHKYINKKRGRNDNDTFPTLYKLNTENDQRRTAEKTGFELLEIEHIEGRPEYLRINPLTYIVGIAYERIVNYLGIKSLKVILLSTFRKR